MINPYLAAMFLSVTVASFSQILLKKSAMKTYESPIREYLNIWVISGYGLLVCSMLISLWAYGGVEYKNRTCDRVLGQCVSTASELWLFQRETDEEKNSGHCVYYGRHCGVLFLEKNLAISG